MKKRKATKTARKRKTAKKARHARVGKPKKTSIKKSHPEVVTHQEQPTGNPTLVQDATDDDRTSDARSDASDWS